MPGHPTFTVLLPATRRGALARDALTSVLEQSFRDFEVIVSNNGADAAVRAAMEDRLDDPRVRYIEQPEILAMPRHWELISRLARGRYLTVVPDRSVLKQGALAAIAEAHAGGGADAEIVTWPWDLYFTESGLLQTLSSAAPGIKVLDSEAVALDSLRIGVGYPTALARGLNSSVSQTIVGRLRDRFGAVFQPLCPDFSFAYACALAQPRLTYLLHSQMISQGLSVSNGARAYLTDATSYIEAVGVSEPFRYSPIKVPFVENLIVEDFFSACHRFGRPDLLAKVDLADPYLKCFSELDEKKAAGLLSCARIEQMAADLDRALAREPVDLQARVRAGRRRPTGLQARMRRRLKQILGSRIESLRPLLTRMRGGRHFKSALQAAGHKV
jgi:hypothetical protein